MVVWVSMMDVLVRQLGELDAHCGGPGGRQSVLCRFEPAVGVQQVVEGAETGFVDVLVGVLPIYGAMWGGVARGLFQMWGVLKGVRELQPTRV